MDFDEPNIKGFLEELYKQTGGDFEKQVSMYDVGAAVGLDKTEAGSLAEELIVQEQVELKTLAGGISMTTEGLAILGIPVPTSPSAESCFQLGEGPVAEEDDRRTVDLLLEEIKNEMSNLDLKYDLLEEIVLDLKTIEVYMLSPRPKIAVLRELFRSLQNAFESVDAVKVAGRLRAIVS